ncbi:unnamed protein product [Notodromas monacha]|uniref:Nose resistant-to-fluoxetine protein N-terminal domain-containing protein n=1 Tax=Notodromas monacha TaxID=399045 RepID=A0A7R9BBP3_9CRUS|nr:unnamed protein product [Notodromas monacha]CAG0912234.1 unnamed protein product [Notodromas monacha]
MAGGVDGGGFHDTKPPEVKNLSEQQCLNDLGWYAYHLENLAEDLGDEQIIISFGGTVFVNATVGELLEMVTATLPLRDPGTIIHVSITDENEEVIFQESLSNLMMDAGISVAKSATVKPVSSSAIKISVTAGNRVLGSLRVPEEFFDASIDEKERHLFFRRVKPKSFEQVQRILQQLEVKIPPPTRLETPPEWVVNMIDASGLKSPSSNFLRGNFFNFGNFEQCLRTNATEANSITPDNVTQLEATSFRGKYCLLTIALVNDTIEEPTTSIVFGPVCDLCVVAGACFPDSCTQNMLQYLRASVGVQSAVSTCSVSEGKPFSTLEIIMTFVSMLWVLLGHTYSNARRAFHTDPLTYFTDLRNFWSQPIINAYPSVDTFFFLSGLLASYMMLMSLKKQGLSFSFFGKLYMHRFFRITPLYAVVMLITYAFMERIGSGPMWPTIGENFFKGCATKWWHNLLYVSTLLSPSQECVLHGWFLTNDMIYFVFSPLIVVPLLKYPKAGMVWVGIVLIASAVVPALIHVIYEVPGVMTYAVLNDERVDKFMDYVYYRPYTRFGVYVVGLLAGYVFHIMRNKRVKLHMVAVHLGWILSFTVGLLIIYGTYEYINWDREMNEALAIVYGSLHHQAWGCALFCVIFLCHKGYGGFVNSFLSWSAFKPLGKLAYSSYLVHWYVIVWSVFGSKTQKQFDIGMQTFHFIGNVIITHLLAFCAAVVVEFPFGSCFNILLSPRPQRPGIQVCGDKGRALNVLTMRSPGLLGFAVLAVLFANVGICIGIGSNDVRRSKLVSEVQPIRAAPLSLSETKNDPPTVAEITSCLNDLGWYYLYLSQIAEDVSNVEVVVTIAGNAVVNSTIGEILGNNGTNPGNLAQLVTITVDYENVTLVEVTAAEIIGYLTNTVSLDELIGELPDINLVGDEVLGLQINVNFAGVPISDGIQIGQLITDQGNQTAVTLLLLDILANGLTVSTSGGMLSINGIPLPEIIAIFGLTGMTGPLIDFGNLMPDISFPNANFRPVPGWVIQVIDASGVKSMPAGFLRGASWTIGNFEQCMSLRASELLEGIFQNPVDGANITIYPTNFEGQYCFAKLGPFLPTTARLPVSPALLPLGQETVSGVCLPASCPQSGMQVMGLLAAAQLPVQYFFDCSTSKSPSLSTVEIVTMIILFLVGITLIAGTLVDFSRTRRNKAKGKLQGKDDSGDNMLMQIITSFSIIKNAEVILCLQPVPSGKDGKPKKNPDVIECLHGMSVDTFFFMSGLLVSYVMLKKLTRYGFSWGFVPQMYIHRYLRLTPLYGMAILISYAFFQRIGSGPFWPSAYQQYVQPCEDKWWQNILYVSTIINPNQECFGHGWYLTNDMLYFLIAPFLVVPLYLSGSWALGYSFMLLGASFGINAAVHTKFDAPGALPFSVMGSVTSGNFMKYIYFRPHTRFGIYVVGIITGFWLFKLRGKRLQLSGGSVLLGWLLAIATGLAIVYGLYEPNAPISEDALLTYGVVHRQVWGLALAWVVFACSHGYGGFINTFLSWSAFKPLGNLAYSCYLVHFHIVGWNIHSSKTQRRLDVLMQTYNFIGNLILTHAFAFCTAVAIEYPLMRVSNILIDELPRKLFRKSTSSMGEDYYTWKQNRRAERITINADDGLEMKKL